VTIVMNEENYLRHYGILRKSGRYPWGSGASQSTRNRSFLDMVDTAHKQGMSYADIAKGYDMSSTQLLAAKSIAINQQRQEKIAQVERLKEKGLSNIAIGRRMGINESSVRALLAPGAKDNANVLTATANMLKGQIEQKKYVDVGVGTEKLVSLSDNPAASIGVSSDKFKTAVAMLQEEGYKLHYIKVPQVGNPGKFTTRKVLTKPSVGYSEVYNNRHEIQTITDFSDNGGRTYLGIHPPLSLSSKRVGINYAEDGGAKADGIIYVRPGVKDVSIGKSNYAQVRIAVDGSHYLKGVAVYKDDLPPGVDVVFNTNKANTGRKKDAMKEMEKVPGTNTIDPDNPFGAQIKADGQQVVKDFKGKERVTSVMNIINEEGDWDTWSRSLSSQVLSKQSPTLAKQQLNMTYEDRLKTFHEINSLTNPSVKQRLMNGFADETDAASVHLKAASLPAQATKLLLPINSMKENEVYAPSFDNGVRLALIRFPHGGTFEIPQLTVNNKNREARKIIGTHPVDAIGIHSEVAKRLSGADFDGDYVLAIPNNKGSIKSTPALEGLKEFDPRHSYAAYDGMRTIDGGVYNAKTKSVDYGGRQPRASGKQHEMGKITNLIADMTIKGANPDEVARAVRHSMVVIDSEKHVLDYKNSFAANGIAQLKEKYQGKTTAGASTLITRTGSSVRVPEYKPRPQSQGGPIDPVTGKKVFKSEPESFVNKQGETVVRKVWATRGSLTGDAHTLSSGNPVEVIYADHANRLKALANAARKEVFNTTPTPYSPSAAKIYVDQVSSLNAKLNIAEKNAPLERQAQTIADGIVSQRKQANPYMDEADEKKIKSQALIAARARTGAGKARIKEITQEEWNAIQAGAISPTKLNKILNNTNLEAIKKLATPKAERKMSSSKILRAKSMLASGYTQKQVADQLGVSLSTLKIGISE
jgi:DNA-binding CsgD family transcriptional regulator